MASQESSETTKTCTKCGETKPIETFRKGRRTCKDCNKAYCKAWRNANKAHCLAYDKGYREEHIEQRHAGWEAWYAANRELSLASHKKYRKTHKEQRQASWQVWYAANKEHQRQRSKRYNTDNKRKKAHWQSKRKARRKQLPVTFTHEEEQFCRQYFSFACAVCNREEAFDAVIGIDHWIPLSSPACPGSTATNLIPLCHGERGCNNAKGKKDPKTWLIARVGTRKAADIIRKIEAYFVVVRLQFP